MCGIAGYIGSSEIDPGFILQICRPCGPLTGLVFLRSTNMSALRASDWLGVLCSTNMSALRPLTGLVLRFLGVLCSTNMSAIGAAYLWQADGMYVSVWHICRIVRHVTVSPIGAAYL